MYLFLKKAEKIVENKVFLHYELPVTVFFVFFGKSREKSQKMVIIKEKTRGI